MRCFEETFKNFNKFNQKISNEIIMWCIINKFLNVNLVFFVVSLATLKNQVKFSVSSPWEFK